MKQKQIAIIITCFIPLFVILVSRDKTEYFAHQGKVFGTYYNIQYEAAENLEDSILRAFERFDHSLSMFNPSSVISRINQNKDTIVDDFFEEMWTEATLVSQLSGGAFDITVAPLVNLWGFGFKNREEVTHSKIDSILPFVGYSKVHLVDGHIEKADTRTMLDASAVAKGQACDVVARLLQEMGCENYLVDIGGEVVAHGVNDKGNAWRIGITKPVDDPMGQSKALEEIIESTDLCMATSGNYRNFYYEGNQRRTHTIDPRTGYPVAHKLLSATVVASSCMRADALATACMVLGEEEGLAMIEKTEDAECYFIVAEGDSTTVYTSKGWAF